MQFPKELQHAEHVVGELDARASMKCSSRRNCNRVLRAPGGGLYKPQ